MVTVAVLFDSALFAISLLNFIPVLGQPIALLGSFIINFYAYLIFITWLLVLRVKPGIVGSSIALIVGWIPFLPPWTLWISLRIVRDRHKRRRLSTAAIRSTVRK